MNDRKLYYIYFQRSLWKNYKIVSDPYPNLDPLDPKGLGSGSKFSNPMDLGSGLGPIKKIEFGFESSWTRLRSDPDPTHAHP